MAAERDLNITQWLQDLAARGNNPSAAGSSELFGMLYDDLHRMARNQMRREQPGHTLSATALTHEAWLRMSEQSRTQWVSRAHYLAVASTVMRRILVNHAEARRAAKRDVLLVSMTLGELVPGPAPGDDVVAVHEVLQAFEQVDPRAAKVVELRFFGGMENAEIAEALGISIATVKREWNIARAWLLRELGSPDGSRVQRAP